MQGTSPSETSPSTSGSFAEQLRKRTGNTYQPSAANNATRQQGQASQETPGVLDRLSPAELSADKAEVARFVQAVFRRCVDDDKRPLGGRVALRAFTNAKGNAPVMAEWEPLAGKPVARAAEAATRVAQRPAGGAVFAPPVCLFNDNGKAGEADVLAGPVVVADLDANPIAGKQAIEAILGPATVVVASGGQWAAPDGSRVDKLHIYWRLERPAISDDEKALLRAVRKRVAELAGGDPTAASLCHPMRWPGSWHTKDAPRLCKIVGGDEAREIDLHAAAKLVGVDLAKPGADRSHRPAGQSFTTKAEWSAEQLMDVAKKLPNPELQWDDFNRVLMAFYDASHGGPDGLEAAHTFSEKSAKYDHEEVDSRWSHYGSYPPDRISGAWLVDRIREQVDPMYCLPRPELTAEERERLDELFGGAGAKRIPASAATMQPQDIFGHDAPARLRNPPVGCFPNLLARWVRSEARRKGASEAFTSAAALATIGSAIGSSLKIQVRERDTDFIEPAPIWCVLVADPGSAKSPVISAALRPLKELDGEWLAADRPKHAEWSRAAKQAARKGGSAPPEPRLRRIFVDDVTAEKQVGIHADNPRGIMRSTDELAGMLETFGAYKRGGGGDRSMMLRLFDGDSITVDRVTTGNLFAKHALMGVLAGSQPDKLRPMVKDLQSDGLLQRFIFVLDDGARVSPVDEEADIDAAKGYRSMIRYFATAEYIFPSAIKIAGAARQSFKEFLEQVDALREIPGASGAWKGHASKWEKIAARIILTFHAIEQYELFEGVQPQDVVGQGTVERALDYCRFMLRHSLAFYSQYFEPDAAHADAVGIAGFLLTKPELAAVKRRDIYQARATLKGADNLRKLLHAARSLEEAGWLAVDERAADGPVSWQVNPQVHSRFAERAEIERIERARRHESILKAAEARQSLEREAK